MFIVILIIVILCFTRNVDESYFPLNFHHYFVFIIILCGFLRRFIIFDNCKNRTLVENRFTCQMMKNFIPLTFYIFSHVLWNPLLQNFP